MRLSDLVSGGSSVIFRSGMGLNDVPDDSVIVVDEVEGIDFGGQFQVLKLMKRVKSFFVFTSRDLEASKGLGVLRDDLYKRLRLFPRVRLTPLRERTDMIPFYVDYFLSHLPYSKNRNLHFEEDVLESFKAYPWPGNLKELNEVVSYMAVSSGGDTITGDCLPERLKPFSKKHTCTFRDLIKLELESMVERLDPGASFTGSIFRDVVSLAEESLIVAALKKSGYIKTRASLILGINRNTLDKKMKRYGIGEGG